MMSIRSLADFNGSSLGGDSDWLTPPPSPPRPQTPGRHGERGIGTSNWPPAETFTWPHTGTFSWPRTLGVARHLVGLTARRRDLPVAVLDLPAQAGRLRRAGPDPRIHPGKAEEAQPRVPQAVRGHRARAQARRPPSRAGSAPAAQAAAGHGPARSGIPAAAVLQVCRRPPPRVHRTESRSRADQGPPGSVPARRPQAGAV